MIWLFIIVILALIRIEYSIYKKMITPFSVMAFPYLLLIPINNLFMTRKGFYSIDNNVIIMIIVGLFFVFVGSVLANNKRSLVSRNMVIDSENVKEEFSLYNFPAMLKYLCLVNAFGFIRFFDGMRRGGVTFFALTENEGFMLRGLIGHILLTAFPLVPIMLYYWLNNKKKILYLLSSLITVFFYFFSFVKYHVVSIVVLVYFFVTFKNRKYLKIGTIGIVSVVIALFLCNYYMGFLSIGTASKVKSIFYFNHLWKYIGGSLIHDNEIFTYGVNAHWGFFYKLGSIISTLPNLFLYAFLKEKPLFNYLESDLGFVSMGYIGEYGNTIDFIGYFYPSLGDINNLIDYVFFGVFFLFLGFISTKLYNSAYDDLCDYPKLISSLAFTVFFCFLSFFGVYASLFMPWELIIWSYVIPNFFYSNARIKFRFFK